MSEQSQGGTSIMFEVIKYIYIKPCCYSFGQPGVDKKKVETGNNFQFKWH